MAVEHVWINMQDGRGDLFGHALTEPDETPLQKRVVVDANGFLLGELEKQESPGVRGWRPVDV